MKITFLGAAQEVTGSKYLVEDQGTKILVDCGIFQGSYKTSQRNWDDFFTDPRTISAVVLTHAHIDHSGYVPALVKKGFKGPIYCSSATFELCKILLKDNGNLQEEAARKFNEYKEAQTPAVQPLYTKQDAENALNFFKVIEYESPITRGPFEITLVRCSHIIGSSFVIISNGAQTLSFSGDLGGTHQLIMQTPSKLASTDYLVLESTYGDRLHEQGDPLSLLAESINKAVAHGGKILIPAFAVGRTQTILYCVYQLKKKKMIPDIPVFLDSPMAIDVTNLFCEFKEDHILEIDECKQSLAVATATPTVEDSKRLSSLSGSAIIIAGSGMMEGGRMVHHLKNYISDPKTLIILVGYQAGGTKGSELLGDEKQIKLFGQMYPVRAQIVSLDMFSAHADYKEILEWLTHFKTAPKKIFLTHGGKEAAQALKERIEKRFGWQVVVPEYEQSFDLE
jgi:metallo-beta-lactamase family protein